MATRLLPLSTYSLSSSFVCAEVSVGIRTVGKNQPAALMTFCLWNGIPSISLPNRILTGTWCFLGQAAMQIINLFVTVHFVHSNLCTETAKQRFRASLSQVYHAETAWKHLAATASEQYIYFNIVAITRQQIYGQKNRISIIIVLLFTLFQQYYYGNRKNGGFEEVTDDHIPFLYRPLAAFFYHCRKYLLFYNLFPASHDKRTGFP